MLCGKQVDENAHDHPYSMKRPPFGAFTGEMVGQTLSRSQTTSGSGKESTQPSQTKQTCRNSRKLFCQMDFDHSHPKQNDHEHKEVPPQVDQSLGLGSDIPSGVTNIAAPNAVHSQLRRLLTHGMNIRSETGIVPETGVGIVPAQPINNNSIQKSATMDHLSLDSPLGLDLLTDLREGNMDGAKSEGSVQCQKGSVQCGKETRRQSKPVQLVFVVSKCSKSTVCIKQGKTTWRPQTRKYCSVKVDQSHKLYICYKCNKAFGSLLTLKRHVLGHTPDKSNLKPFSASMTPPSQIRTWKQKVKGPSKCNQCAGSFTQSASLSRHMKIHSGERSLVCTQCTKAFIYIIVVKSPPGNLLSVETLHPSILSERSPTCRCTSTGTRERSLFCVLCVGRRVLHSQGCTPTCCVTPRRNATCASSVGRHSEVPCP